MSHLTILFIALGLSMDSMAVSISRGICMNRFSIKQSLRIALVMGLFQGGMTLIGWLAGAGFSAYIREVDHWIAFALLSYLGGKMIYESLKPEKSERTELSGRTLLTLAFATSIDALAVGVGFAFLDTDIYLPAGVIAVTTFALSFLGVAFGYRFSKAKKVNIEFFGGAILIAIGMKILLEHTVF